MDHISFVIQTNLIQSTKPLGKCSKRVKCSLGQVCVCHGQTNKLIGLWKVLAYFPQIQMSKFVLDSIFAAKIYPIFTILFILKYLWDQKLNNGFLLSLSKKLQRKQNKEIFRWYFVSCPLLWAGMFPFFVHILQAFLFNFGKFRWKVGFRSWLHARCIARDTALHLLRIKKINFDFEIIYLTTLNVLFSVLSLSKILWVF